MSNEIAEWVIMYDIAKHIVNLVSETCMNSKYLRLNHGYEFCMEGLKYSDPLAYVGGLGSYVRDHVSKIEPHMLEYAGKLIELYNLTDMLKDKLDMNIIRENVVNMTLMKIGEYRKAKGQGVIS